MGLSGKEKFSYGLGAVGKDMVYMPVSYTHLTLPTKLEV